MTLLTGDEYMQLLHQRRAEWEAAHPARVGGALDRIKREHPGANPQPRPGWSTARPLLEWFVRDGDEDLVDMSALESEPQPKRVPRPRVYRSAASLRAERDRVQEQLDAVAGDDSGDMAIVNLSPFSRSRAAAAAGRRRFAKLDRDLERYTRLKRRLERLDSRVDAAEARETNPPHRAEHPVLEES